MPATTGSCRDRSAIRWEVAVGLAIALTGARGAVAAPSVLDELRDLSLDQLAGIEVSSVSKSSERLSDAPAAVYVISHDDIIASGATTIPQMLRLAPNLEVAQVGASRYAISARGFNVGNNASLSNKLLILIDGRSVYSPMFGGIYWDMQGVPPESIERIEVISGPGAVLWGANATNGVINIITRSSADTQGGLVTLGAGNLERNVGIQYGGRLGPNLTYRVHGEFSDFSQFRLPNGAGAGDAWRKPQGGFRIDWTPRDDFLSVQADLFSETPQPTGFIRGADVTTTWQHRFSNGSILQLLAYYDDAERWSGGSSGGFFVHTYNIEAQHNFALGSWNNIVWGAGERVVRYGFEDTPGLRLVPSSQTLSQANVFAQDTISLTDRLKLTLGLKLEDEPYVGVQVMPSVRLAFKPDDAVLLWAAVSRAVRAPTPIDTNLREFIGPIDVINGSTRFLPEALTAYEIGTRMQVSPRATFSVSAYYDVYDKLRSIDPTPVTVLPLTFGNHMEGVVFGVEAWGSLQITNWWRLSAGFTLQHEELRFLPGSTTLAGLAFVANDPGHQASLHSSVNFGDGVTWDAYLRGVGPLPHPSVPGYVELDMRLGWQVNDWLQLSLSGFNLLHDRHMEFLTDGPPIEVPRSVFAQTRIRF